METTGKSTTSNDSLDHPQVLIVDSSSESIDVLQTVLSRRGVSSISARYAEMGLELARSRGPRLIVVDVESLELEGEIVANDFADQYGEQAPYLVLLGKIDSSELKDPQVEILPKPYHYSALIRKIEGLLAAQRAA